MKRKISVPRQIMQPLSTETNINVTLSAKRRVPGVMDFWMLIAAEVTLFSLFFITYMISRNQSLELFVTSQQMLNRHLGAFNTVVLISGSWLVTQAVLMLRQGHVDEARRYLTYAASSGIVFLGVKLFEYGEKISQGISPISNDFFTFYFILTIIHLFHLIVGTIATLVMRQGVTRGIYHRDNMKILESTAIYWHLVDLLWIFLFSLLYLLH